MPTDDDDEGRDGRGVMAIAKNEFILIFKNIFLYFELQDKTSALSNIKGEGLDKCSA